MTVGQLLDALRDADPAAGIRLRVRTLPHLPNQPVFISARLEKADIGQCLVMLQAEIRA